MSPFFSVFLFLIANALFAISTSHQPLGHCGITTMFNFGDSLTDTGNALMEFPSSYAGRFPYGMTIHHATGRFCDGYLFVDRIAEAAGLPHLNPSLNKKLDHSKGANFAVGEVGVLSKELRAKWNIVFNYSQSSVDVQFQWLEQLLDLHNFKDENARRNHLKSSLFLVGGGGNDYGNMKGGNYSRLPMVEQKIAVMPDIMAAINSYVKKLIVDYGATKVVVFGIYQAGNDHNATNFFHALHNQRLQDELQKLREEFPEVRLVYGDLWGAVQSLLDNYNTLGYKHDINDICCGDWKVDCASSPNVSYCRNPNEYWFWDSGHFTSFTHRLLSTKIIPQIASALGCIKM